MICDSTFWLTEKDAPLLNRNRGYITPDNVKVVVERAKSWVDLVNAKGDLSDLPLDSICDDPATNRIFTLDAERTFRDSANRSTMTDTLCKIWSEVQDYHQGLGFIVAFLLLFFRQTGDYQDCNCSAPLLCQWILQICSGCICS